MDMKRVRCPWHLDPAYVAVYGAVCQANPQHFGPDAAVKSPPAPPEAVFMPVEVCRICVVKRPPGCAVCGGPVLLALSPPEVSIA